MITCFIEDKHIRHFWHRFFIKSWKWVFFLFMAGELVSKNLRKKSESSMGDDFLDWNAGKVHLNSLNILLPHTGIEGASGCVMVSKLG